MKHKSEIFNLSNLHTVFSYHVIFFNFYFFPAVDPTGYFGGTHS